jgi:4-amino-4-deoxy-L-arabinose transferase-like glycosyltransferase
MNEKIRDYLATSALLWFGLSMVVHFIFIVLINDAPLKYDEPSYYHRAVSLYDFIRQEISSGKHDRNIAGKIYQSGVFPPLTSVVMAVGFFLFGKSIFAARLILSILSSLTTSLIFHTSQRFFSKKAAIAAAVIHIFHPSFIGYSHYLLSETLFIFLLFVFFQQFLKLYYSPETQRTIDWLWLGVILGLMALARISVLPILAVSLIWLAMVLKNWKNRFVAMFIVLISMMAVVFPWQYWLFKNEGKFVVLSSFNYRNLYLGNNLWEANYKKRESYNMILEEAAKEKNYSVEEAARDLAYQEIIHHPFRFLERSVDKLFILWSVDFTPLLYFLNGIYPMVPSLSILSVWILLLVFHFFIIVFFFIWFSGYKKDFLRWMVLSFLLASSIPFMICYGNTRYNLPNIALMIPFAGLGFFEFCRNKWKYRKMLIGIFLVFIIMNGYTHSHFITRYLHPSSYYAHFVKQMDSIFHSRTETVDTVIFYYQPKAENPISKEILLKILNPNDYSFNEFNGAKSLSVNLSEKNPYALIQFVSLHPRNPLHLGVESADHKREIEINPLQPDYRKGQPLKLFKGLSVYWKGGM